MASSVCVRHPSKAWAAAAPSSDVPSWGPWVPTTGKLGNLGELVVASRAPPSRSVPNRRPRPSARRRRRVCTGSHHEWLPTPRATFGNTASEGRGIRQPMHGPVLTALDPALASTGCDFIERQRVRHMSAHRVRSRRPPLRRRPFWSTSAPPESPGERPAAHHEDVACRAVLVVDVEAAGLRCPRPPGTG